jgi:hypothetical protein
MIKSKIDAQDLIDVVSRYEALPSRERMANVRSAVLRRALVGGVATAAGSTSLLAKATALGATTAGHIAAYVAVGALAGGTVVGVATMSSWLPAKAPVAVTTSVAPPAPIGAPSTPIERRLTNETSSAPIEPPDEAPAAAADLSRSTPRATATFAPQATAPEIPRELPSPREIEKESVPMLVAKPAEALPRQLELLRQMRLDLAERRGLHALSVYRENYELFRGGPMEPEARAAFIAALCQVGRTDEANLETARFQAAFPSSHVARRLAAGCASEPSGR